jgi:hypothetical protein
MKRDSWLLLLYGLPTRRNAERVNLWRKLKKFGAIHLETSGYVLPDEPAQYERFQWLGKQIQDAGGQTTLMRVVEIDGLSSEEVVAMFNEARAVEYREMGAACKAALTRYRKGRESELAAELERQKRRFKDLQGIDYFDSPAAHDAQMLLRRVEKALTPQKGNLAARKLEARHFIGKTWLTRPRPGIDRAGSGWLIRQFIDPTAKFIFDTDPRKHPDALAFDMADVEFTHHGDDCTFETLVKRFGITDQGVSKIAEMVHDADLEDDKFHRCECFGINAVLSGWSRGGMSDDELLNKGIECFEGLYREIAQ